MSKVAFHDQEAAEAAYIHLAQRIFDPKITPAEFKLVSKELEEVRDFLEQEYHFDRYDFVNLCRKSRGR